MCEEQVQEEILSINSARPMEEGHVRRPLGTTEEGYVQRPLGNVLNQDTTGVITVHRPLKRHM